MAKSWNEYIKDLEKKIPELSAEALKSVGGKGGILGGVLEGFTNAIVGFVATFIPGIVAAIPDGITAGIDYTKERYKEGFTKNASVLLNLIKGYGLLDETGEKRLNEITKTFGMFQSPLLMICIVMIVIDYIKGIMQASMGKQMQQYNSAFSPFALDASSAVRSAFVAPELYDQAFDALKRNGISDKDIDLLFVSAYRLLEPDTIRNLFLRKAISPDEMRKALREHGYTDTRIDKLVETWQLIPGPQDLITMAVREAFDERKASELGLDADPQPAFTEWAEKQGLSAYWAKMYWRAHWQLPSPQMGYEMVHRGLATEEELRQLLTALDYSPRWHDALMGINYNLITRVDIRRIFELGLINPDQMEERYRNLGYSPADAKLLRAWTEVEYNQEYKDITKTEVINQYLEGIIEESQLKAMLDFMGYTPERVQTMVELAQYKRSYAKQTARLTALRKLYITGEYNYADVQRELAPFNIDPRRIAERVDQWELERRAGITPPKKAELDRWYMENIIDGNEYIEEMQKIGYSEKNIARYAASISLAKKAQSESK